MQRRAELPVRRHFAIGIANQILARREKQTPGARADKIGIAQIAAITQLPRWAPLELIIEADREIGEKLRRREYLRDRQVYIVRIAGFAGHQPCVVDGRLRGGNRVDVEEKTFAPEHGLASNAYRNGNIRNADRIVEERIVQLRILAVEIADGGREAAAWHPDDIIRRGGFVVG